MNRNKARNYIVTNFFNFSNLLFILLRIYNYGNKTKARKSKANSQKSR